MMQMLTRSPVRHSEKRSDLVDESDIAVIRQRPSADKMATAAWRLSDVASKLVDDGVQSQNSCWTGRQPNICSSMLGVEA